MPQMTCSNPDCSNILAIPLGGFVNGFYWCSLHATRGKLTGEVQDDSIDRAFKRLKNALRERARIYNKFINEHHGRLTLYTPGIYKTQVIRVWDQALELADLAVRDSVKDLKRLIDA